MDRTLDAAVELIEAQASAIDALTEGLEATFHMLDPDKDVEDLMIQSLSLTNTARSFVHLIRDAT